MSACPLDLRADGSPLLTSISRECGITYWWSRKRSRINICFQTIAKSKISQWTCPELGTICIGNTAHHVVPGLRSSEGAGQPYLPVPCDPETADSTGVVGEAHPGETSRPTSLAPVDGSHPYPPPGPSWPFPLRLWPQWLQEQRMQGKLLGEGCPPGSLPAFRGSTGL